MPKDTINFKKVLCTWFIWTIVYFCLMDIFCCSFLDFSPLSSDWAIRIGNFLNDRWVIVTGKDWLLLLIIVAFWPVYFVGWHRAYRFDWKRIMPRCFRKKPLYPDLPIRIRLKKVSALKNYGFKLPLF